MAIEVPDELCVARNRRNEIVDRVGEPHGRPEPRLVVAVPFDRLPDEHIVQAAERKTSFDEAIGTKDAYDDDYFEKFFANIRPVLEQRLSESITATASVIAAAWEQDGRPTVTLERPRTVQKVRKP